MIIVNGEDNLWQNLMRQLSSFWEIVNFKEIEKALPLALERLEILLSANSKYNVRIWKNDEVVFNPLNSVQYSCFLYLLSNTLYSNNLQGGADKIYYLNKIMNAVDWFYATELPTHFFAEHPIGSVMGKATYGDNFFFYQGCTVGVNYLPNGEITKPIIGDNVLMLSNSSIYGSSKIGNNVIISATSKIINDFVPDNCIVFGQSPNLVIKEHIEEKMIKRLSAITNLHY